MIEYPTDLHDRLAGLPEWLKHYSGSPLVLVFGCGPSLDQMPDIFWHESNAFLKGCVNGVPLIKSNVPFDIWLCIDDIRTLDKSENYPGVRSIWGRVEPKLRPLRLMAAANRSSVVTDLFVDHCTEWNDGRLGVCKYGRSSVQALVHWIAVAIKPRKIALFGVDYNGAGRAGGFAGNTSHQHGENVETVFGELYENCKSINVDLVNCSPGTGLQAIPQVDWKEAFNEICVN